MNLTNSIPTVSWEDLQGNKYNKSLDVLMLRDEGLTVSTKGKITGKPKSELQIVNVVYDKQYVTNWIIIKLIKPFSNYGLKVVVSLIKDAWKQSNYPTEGLVIPSNLSSLPKITIDEQV